MLFGYIACLGAIVAFTLAYRLTHPTKIIISYIYLGAIALFSIMGFMFGFLYGRELFKHDDPHLGGWIFACLALAFALASLTAVTWVKYPLISKIALGCCFALMVILLVMCIFESKAAFATGIGVHSPDYVPSSSDSALFLLFNL